MSGEDGFDKCAGCGALFWSATSERLCFECRDNMATGEGSHDA